MPAVQLADTSAKYACGDVPWVGHREVAALAATGKLIDCQAVLPATLPLPAHEVAAAAALAAPLVRVRLTPGNHVSNEGQRELAGAYKAARIRRCAGSQG
jgi:hypothetical protein